MTSTTPRLRPELDAGGLAVLDREQCVGLEARANLGRSAEV
jgi:hypothetical protein